MIGMYLYSRVVVVTLSSACVFLFFFFNDTATTEIYTLSLHDALPIYFPREVIPGFEPSVPPLQPRQAIAEAPRPDRKSTRLNSSHLVISYAVFCLKKKKKMQSRQAHQNDRRDHPAQMLLTSTTDGMSR